MIGVKRSSNTRRGIEDIESGPDSEIPPAIACAHCGLPTCDGCAPQPTEPVEGPAFTLPWEDETYRGFRLLETARATGLDEQRVFASLAQRPASSTELGAALVFATVAEIWAVASFSLPWAIASLLFFPRLTRHMATSPGIAGLGLSILAGLVLIVVLIHLLWGLTLELGVKRAGKKPDFRAGLRFGLYSCGWDLLTSPAGLFLHLLTHGYKEALRTLSTGARVPRRAMAAYLIQGRKLSEGQSQRATRLSIWLTGAAVVAGALMLFFALLLWMLDGYF